MIIDANEPSAYAVVGVPTAYSSAFTLLVTYDAIDVTSVTLTYATLTGVTLEPS